jgi:putative solute:sodium symporter small subunit
MGEEALVAGGQRVGFGVGAPSLRIGPALRVRSIEGGSTQPMAAPADTPENEKAHWDKTTRLMLTHLGVWLFFGYIVHFFVGALNNIQIPILGFPLGFYMAAQGSLIAFVVMLFLFARQQDKIDRDHGYAEED